MEIYIRAEHIHNIKVPFEKLEGDFIYSFIRSQFFRERIRMRPYSVSP